MQLTIKTPLAMRKLGSILAGVCLPGAIIYLQGNLGAGKTTFTRGFLRGLGYKGRVKSPTFNLFETYQLKGCTVCHFDLYRLIDSEELVYVGIKDYFDDKNICLIEWPEKGKGHLAESDLYCSFDFAIKGKSRVVNIEACSTQGEAMMPVLKSEKMLKNSGSRHPCAL